MENNIKWLFSEIGNIITDILWSGFSSAFLLGIIGLIVGIILVRRLHKKKLLNRPNKVWTVLAKLNYVYIPILLMLTLGTIGGLNGVHRSVNKWIDNSTEQAAAYATAFVPAMQGLGEYLDQSVTVDEAVMQFISQNQKVPNNKQAQIFVQQYNTAITYAFLDELGYPYEIDGLVRMLREQDLSSMDASFFTRIPNVLKSQSTAYFMPVYLTLFLVFLPFLLIPIGELVLFFFFRKGAKITSNLIPNRTNNSI